MIAHATTDDRLLVSYGDVAPREDGEQLAIVPEVGPVVALGTSSFEDEQTRRSIGWRNDAILSV